MRTVNTCTPRHVELKCSILLRSMSLLHFNQYFNCTQIKVFCSFFFFFFFFLSRVVYIFLKVIDIEKLFIFSLRTKALLMKVVILCNFARFVSATWGTPF